jgi:uncharacterized protein YecE (DUF72 family)
MGEILIGTSGYYYDDWKGTFYPEGLPQKELLAFYAQNFNIIELNFTYYKLPDDKQINRMMETSGNLLFTVKAYKGITHEITTGSIKNILPRFLGSISPLHEKGRLETLLIQFPLSFHYTDKNRIYLREVLEAMSPFPACVEFRNKEWLKESVYDGLKTLTAGFVCVDEPDLPGLIPPVAIATSKAGYIRFHGRNKKNWYGTDSTARYDYLYSEEELKGWVPAIRNIATETEKLYIFFNNHAKSQAVTNARMLINLLK